LLKLAIDAELPVVAVSTRDTLNFPDVMKEITDRSVQPFTSNMPTQQHTLYMHMCKEGEKLPLDVLYAKMIKHESTIVLVNPHKIEDSMFDAGEVPVPRSLMMKLMNAIVSDKKRAEELLRGLGGCTIKEAAELCRLTMARDKSLTVQGLMATRKASFQSSKGLTQVDANQGFYDPPKQLAEWVARERSFFLTGTDHRLMPRGLLMDGPPGTGKTAGAKWIAAQLGVPLYRVDIGGTKNKYVGASEANLLNALARIDAEAPCCVLIDEIEKVFASNSQDTSGTTSTMLSQLLWWLAERRSRVLAIMTTNKASALPRELYREGRVDKVMMFEGLNHYDAVQFARAVFKTFPKAMPAEADIQLVVKPLFYDDAVKKVSQTVLTQSVYQFIKSGVTG
jgi:ATPase family associated with various cellular activities (AAA)